MVSNQLSFASGVEPLVMPMFTFALTRPRTLPFCALFLSPSPMAAPPLLLPRVPNNLCSSLQLTHSLLNRSSPSLGKNCWLCISMCAATYMVTPVPPQGWTLTYYPQYETKGPLQLLDQRSLTNFFIDDVEKNLDWTCSQTPSVLFH